jgi:hypothetical protein
MDAAADTTAAAEEEPVEDVDEGTPVRERTVQANHIEQGTPASTSEQQTAAEEQQTEQQTLAAAKLQGSILSPVVKAVPEKISESVGENEVRARKRKII